MVRERSRRSFLADVGRGTLLATLGPAMLTDLGLAPKAFAEELDSTLRFGDLEPLVCELQETPVERLQSTLAKKLRGGLPLKTLVAAGALANARTFRRRRLHRLPYIHGTWSGIEDVCFNAEGFGSTACLQSAVS